MPPYIPYDLPGFTRREIAFLRTHLGHQQLLSFIQLRKQAQAEVDPVPYETPLEELPGFSELTRSARKALGNDGIITVGDACKQGSWDFDHIPKVGIRLREKLFGILAAAGRYPGELQPD